MCTLVLLHRVVPDAPVIVLANRDEMLARPAQPPAAREGSPRVFCGIDEHRSGTWCGINEHGVFVGLTNRTGRSPDPARRSRGLLCLDMLRLPTIEAIKQMAEALAKDAYNGFHIVAADRTRALRVRYLDRPELEMPQPGIHVTTNWPAGSDGEEKTTVVEGAVRHALQASTDLAQLLEALQKLAGLHVKDGDPRASICCHMGPYGTRSSSVIVLGSPWPTATFLHSEGAPCTSAFHDLSEQARQVCFPGL